MKEKLEKISRQLEPDDVEEDYLSKFVDGHAPSVSDATSVYEDDENDDEYETDEGSIEVYQVEAFGDFNVEKPGDLQFKKGDVLTIIETRDDGWWVGENKDGKRGLVPSTLLKILETDDIPAAEHSKVSSEKKVPFADRPPLEQRRSGKDLWQSLKMSKQETTVDVVLKAMKAVPSGFRASTLGALAKKEMNKTSFWLTPKLSSSNLGFRDLFWDPVNRKLLPRNTKLTRTFTLLAAKCIPPPGAGLEIKSRHVRIAFWDGEHISGNIHTVRAVVAEKDEQNWNFTPKVSVFLPCLYDGECIARINSSTNNLALLFELNYSYVRTTTGEKGELSSGWCSLPLFENDGSPVVNKNYELQLRGGTPYEKGVDVDTTVALKASQSLFLSLVRTNKQPRLVVKLTPFNRLAKANYDLLPDLLITCDRNVKFIVLYRELLAATYLKDERLKGGFICDPVLANFCRAFDFSDLVDSLLMTWNERTRSNLTRSQKRDPAHMLKFFRKCFIDSTFSIMQSADLPPYSWANEVIEQKRLQFITGFLASRNPVALVFSPDSRFRPFNAQKVSFDILSKNCLLAAEPDAPS